MVSGLNLNVSEVVFSKDYDAVKIKLIRQNDRRRFLRRKCCLTQTVFNSLAKCLQNWDLLKNVVFTLFSFRARRRKFN